MMLKMKERRKEQAATIDQRLKEERPKIKDSVSKSYAGKLLDQNLCKRFRAIHVDDGKHVYQKAENKNNIDKITSQLVSDTNKIYQKWKHERLQDDHVNLMLASLTSDKRV